MTAPPTATRCEVGWQRNRSNSSVTIAVATESLPDGRAARRLKRRYRVERSISWLLNNRRLVVRYDRYDHLFLGFATLACVIQLLNKF